MHLVIVLDDLDEVALVPSVTSDAQSVVGNKRCRGGFGVGHDGRAAGDGFGNGHHVEVAAGVHQQCCGPPEGLRQLLVAQETMKNDIILDAQSCRQMLQRIGLVTVTDDVQPIVLIGVLGD